MRERGSQIPAFGNWEYVNDLPITQYFECARQAGLIRYSSSSGECCDHHHHHPPTSVSPDFIKPRTVRPKQVSFFSSDHFPFIKMKYYCSESAIVSVGAHISYSGQVLTGLFKIVSTN